jgi:hypothetical protein
MTDLLSPKQLDAMFEAVNDAELAREERKLHADHRRGYIVDYLLAAEAAENAPKDTAKAEALANARAALAAYLVGAGEYATVEDAAAAADARTVWAMPKPGADYSKVVPF